jgi:GT2 family glycosyltransferase
MPSLETEGDPRPWVRVIIVNYNAGAYIQACVDALAGQTFRDFEAVVVDNASADRSPDTLSLPDPRFSLIANERNLGFAAANNIGASGCRAPWIATLNPDTVAEPTWLEEMHRGVESHPGVGMFGATLVNAADASIVDGFGDALSIAGIPWRAASGDRVDTLPRCDAEVFSPCAAAALYDRQSFERAGGFDETFFCYLEDVDLGFRLRLAGERCMQLRNAIVRHHGSAITGETSDFTLFHSYRNRLWLVWKDMPLLLLFVAVPLNIACSLNNIIKLAFRRQPVRAPLRGLIFGFPPVALLTCRRRVQLGRQISTIAVARSLVWNLFRLRYRPVVFNR